MTPEQVVRYYGSQAKAADGLGVSPQVIHNWIQRKRVPLEWQLDIEVETAGKLKLDRKRRRNGGK